MGPCGDRFGRKPLLIISLLGSFIGMLQILKIIELGDLMQALSKTMTWLIFWRAFTGLFAGSMIIVQA